MFLDLCQPCADFFQQRTGQILLTMTIFRLGTLQNQAAFRCRDELRKNSNDFILGQNPQRSVRYTLYLASDPQASVAEVNRLPVNADNLSRAKRANKCQMDGKMKDVILLDCSQHITHPIYVPGAALDCFLSRGSCDWNGGDVVPFQRGLKAGGQHGLAFLHTAR